MEFNVNKIKNYTMYFLYYINLYTLLLIHVYVWIIYLHMFLKKYIISSSYVIFYTKFNSKLLKVINLCSFIVFFNPSYLNK